jgi:hypothetical protein
MHVVLAATATVPSSSVHLVGVKLQNWSELLQ